MKKELMINSSETAHEKVDRIPITVSIIIVTFNALDCTRLCLSSIQKNTDDVDYELIIVDNNSNSNTTQFLTEISDKFNNIRIIFNDTNTGFAAGVNAGIRISQGNYLVLLNNDTLVTKNWLSRLVENIELEENIGLISPITNNVQSGPQLDEKARSLKHRDVVRYANKIYLDNKGIIINVPNRLSFFCVLIKKEVFEKVGLLDENFKLGNYEDDDFCIRAIMSGFKLAVTKEVFIYHFGGKTFSKNKIDHSMFMLKNMKYFYEKMGKISTSKHESHKIFKKTDISIITRTYNRPLKLMECLQSLENQTYKDFEVIIVNDAGDDVNEIISEFEESLDINYIYHKTNQGRSISLNSGIQASSGKFIAYLDDDDIYYPNHLEILIKALSDNKYKVAYTDANKALYRFFDNKNMLLDIQQYASWKFNKDEMLVHNLIPNLTLMHARECIDEIGDVNPLLSNHEDYDFLIRLSQKYDFFHIPIVTCEYRFYEGKTNFVVGQRKLMLNTLKQVYMAHSAPNWFVNQSRKSLVYLLKDQIKKINTIENSIDEEKIKESKILKLITGLSTPEYNEEKTFYEKNVAKFDRWLMNHGYIRLLIMLIISPLTKIWNFIMHNLAYIS